MGSAIQLKEYTVADLLAISPSEIEGKLPPVHIVRFPDNTLLLSSPPRTRVSRTYWELFCLYPGAVIGREHMLPATVFKKSSDVDLLQTLFWDVRAGHMALHPDAEDPVWRMAKSAYEIQNTMYNMYVSDLGKYGSSVDLDALSEIMTHPQVVSALKANDDGDIDLDETYRRIISFMQSPLPELRDNGIARLSRCNLLSLAQTVQMVGRRGQVSAADGRIYKYPLKGSFGNGLGDLYSYATESRSASLSLYMTDGPLKDTEYFNRRMQLVCAIIQGIKLKDCGDTKGIRYQVGDYDIPTLEGRYRILEDGTHTRINIDDVHLIGKEIQVRSITTCRSPDPTHSCKVCMGDIHVTMPPHTNYGHFLTVYVLSKLSQLILSTKHVVTSAEALTLVLSKDLQTWFRLDKLNKSQVRLQRGVGNVMIRVPAEGVFGRNIVLHHKGDVGTLSPPRISCIPSLKIAQMGPSGTRTGNWIDVDVSVGGIGSALSTDVLREMHLSGWENEDGELLIRLPNFGGNSVFITPRRNDSMMDYVKRFMYFIFAGDPRAGKGDSIANYDTPDAAIAALRTIVDERVPEASFGNIEVFIRAVMTVAGRRNLNLPVGGEPFKFVSALHVLSGRSTSAVLVYQGQRKVLTTPGSLLRKVTQDHPIDCMFGE